jgi:hypothetical protein
MSALRSLAALLLVAGLACTSVPIHDVASSVPPGLTAGQVREAIQSAAVLRHWVVSEESPSVLLATLDVRGKHSATVAIAYDATRYSITYRDSRNLDYEDGEIHKNYNGWVLKLDKTIRNELVRASRLGRGPS